MSEPAVVEYAVIKAGGSQVRVAPGETHVLEKTAGEPGAEIVFPNVLLLAKGGAIEVGAPYVAGASVKAQVLGHGRGRKIRLYRFKKKKGRQRTLGHRQSFTRIRITEIAKG
jgi:large subunit ribosomal protein L21